jgi:radical SAM superfamily enzyme YgiQ (UPF0313 family)
MERKRVGLVSIGGVRVHSERLASYGVSLPGFVERGKVIASLPSLAMLTLAAVTPEDAAVDLEYLEVNEADAAGLAAVDEAAKRFDAVAVSSYAAKAHVGYAVADRFRERGTTVFLGGLHATLVGPEEPLAHADAVALGEGEDLWPRMLRDWRGGKLEKVYREEKPGTYDVRRTPAPRFDLLDMTKFNRITVQTSRGCPHDCEFCAASKIYGPAYRVKTVPQVVAEIGEIKKQWENPFIEFADDNTFVRRGWSKELLQALAPLGLQWFTETDISIAEDPDALRALADSGCKQVLIGLESVKATVLDGIDARNWKLKQLDGVREKIDRIQKTGVTVNGTFIVGNDADTPDVFREVADFVRSSNLCEVQVTVLTPFPGTRLYRRLKAEGRLLRERYWEQCTLFDVCFKPKNMSVQELEDGLIWLFQELYNEKETLRRKRVYMDIVKGLLPS